MSDLALEPMHNAPNRPSVLSLAIKEKAALFAAYMPFLKNGGIFVPTNKAYRLGDEIYLILTLLDDPAKYPIAGKVAWVTPAVPAIINPRV
jgi:type IV pilus assembly protein PilZ